MQMKFNEYFYFFIIVYIWTNAQFLFFLYFMQHDWFAHKCLVWMIS